MDSKVLDSPPHTTHLTCAVLNSLQLCRFASASGHLPWLLLLPRILFLSISKAWVFLTVLDFISKGGPSLSKVATHFMVFIRLILI